MGQLVPVSGASKALEAYGGVNPWAEAARGISDGAYLKFNGNTGDFTFGADDEDLPEKSQIVVDMGSMGLGWTCWDDSAVVEEIMVLVTEGKPPLEHELKDHGPYADDDDGWREAASISAVLWTYGADDRDEAVGTKLLFKTSTGGQVRALKKLAGQYGRLFMQHPDELPIVELTVESYMPKNKKFGKKYALNMKIVGWVSAAEAESLMGGEADNEADYDDRPEPVAKKPAAVADEPAPRRRAAPVEQVEEEEPAPAPRRRAAPVEQAEEEEPAPAPRRRAAPVEQAEEEEPAPAPRRRAAPVEQVEEEEPAPAPRRRAAPVEVDAADEDEGDVAPAPRGRSPGRGAPPENARLRKFD